MISVKQLTKVYGHGSDQRTVLDHVDLTVEQGQIFAVVGPSGAGKSTLAHCINLLQRPTSGTVLVDGADLTALSERRLRVARRAIGTVFQSSSLLSRRTAAENVALPLEYLHVTRAERNARVHELLDRVGLTGHAGHYPHELSGGQRQRVGIARALALRPSVLLADEATSGLDPKGTRSVLALLREVRDDLGLTILLITHEMDVVREVADIGALLSDGQIVEHGRLADLLLDPHSRLGRSLQPERPYDAPPAGDAIWHVTYGSASADPEWIAHLSRELGTRVSLLGASVESIGGLTAGRVTIGFPPESPERVRQLLARWGLHGEPEVETLGARPVPGEVAVGGGE